MKTAWSDKAIQYSFVAGPGNPLDLSDRITEFRPYSIDYLVRRRCPVHGHTVQYVYTDQQLASYRICQHHA